MFDLLANIASRQMQNADRNRPHSFATRLAVCWAITFGFTVYYGFFGVMAGIMIYLIGVELWGLPMAVMMIGPAFGVALGLWVALRHCVTYWRRYGH